MYPVGSVKLLTVTANCLCLSANVDAVGSGKRLKQKREVKSEKRRGVWLVLSVYVSVSSLSTLMLDFHAKVSSFFAIVAVLIVLGKGPSIRQRIVSRHLLRIKSFWRLSNSYWHSFSWR